MKPSHHWKTNWLVESLHRRRRVLVALLACAVLTAAIYGCARVTVRKVPTPTQYLRWTDKQQEKADRMEGLRFYLPRPFVNVFESFPVRTDIYLANGLIAPDKKHVIITSVTSESGLGRYIATDPRHVRVPTDHVFDRTTSVSPQSASELVSELGKSLLSGGIGEIVPTGIVGSQTPEVETPAAAPPALSAPQPRTGLGQRKSTNDNGAFAYQPLRGNFDLVYLPDFEEQYVVSETAGLGNAMFEVNLGQGWSLQGFNSLTDNSELNRRIFDLIDSAVRIAKSAASSAFGVPALPDLAPGAGGMVRPQSADEKLTSASKLSGTPVTLKIVVVHYASKGLYPVIKPRELQERALDPGDSFGVLDLFKMFPKVQMSSNFDPTEIKRAQMAIEKPNGSFTIPRYPYQYVSFNTFRYMAIEVVRATDEDTSPFEHLYDKTGTQGEIGDARTGDILGLLERLRIMYAATAAGASTKPPTEPSLADIAETLKERSFRVQEANFKVSGAAVVDGKIAVDLQKTGGRVNTAISRNDLVTAVLAEATRITNDQGLETLKADQLNIRNYDSLAPSLVPAGQQPTPENVPGTAQPDTPTTSIGALKNQSFVVAGVTLNFAEPIEASGKLQVTLVYLSGTATVTVAEDALLQSVYEEATRILIAAGLPGIPKTDIEIMNFADLKAKLTVPG